MSPDPELPEPPDPPALPVEGALVADQVGAHATEGAGHHGPFHTHCENCGTPLAGPWCHRCGQHDFEFHRSFWHVFLEVLETLFHFEGKFFRNIVTLLFRPGRLTADFNAGKRAPQMPPFRLYLFVSVVFFFLLFLQGDKPPEAGRDRVRPAIDSSVNGKPVSPLEAMSAATQAAGEDDEDEKKPAPPATSAAEATHPAPPAAPATAQPERNVDKLRHFAEEMQAVADKEHAAKKQAKGGKDSDLERWLSNFGHRMTDPVHRREMTESFLHSMPKMLLICLPFFALYTRFLFRKSGQVYLQHLVLALHFHTFIYLWMMFRDGWTFLVGLPGWGAAGFVYAASTLWLWIYPVVMLRRLFGNSWKKTLLKTFLLAMAYWFTLMIVMFTGAVIIFAIL